MIILGNTYVQIRKHLVLQSKDTIPYNYDYSLPRFVFAQGLVNFPNIQVNFCKHCHIMIDVYTA